MACIIYVIVHKLDTKFQIELRIANALELVYVVTVIQLKKHDFSIFSLCVNQNGIEKHQLYWHTAYGSELFSFWNDNNSICQHEEIKLQRYS